MTQSLEPLFRVYLYDRPIGSLHRKGDFTRFSFDADYINDPGRAVLGLRFEERLQAHPAANMRLPVWFSNLLPEGRLRAWIGEARQISVERLYERRPGKASSSASPDRRHQIHVGALLGVRSLTCSGVVDSRTSEMLEVR
jgi:HipA-like protein